jgi:hypothetical protein
MEKRNHKTQPLFEGERFIISLGFFFLMKRYYTMPDPNGQMLPKPLSFSVYGYKWTDYLGNRKYYY